MNGIIFICLIALILFIVFILGLRNERQENEKLKNQIINEYGQKPSDRLKSDGAHLSAYHEKHNGEYYIDDITWNDLSMGDVFDRLNYCESSAGEEYLYYLLRNPRLYDDGSFLKLEEKIKSLSDDEKARINYKKIFLRCGKSMKYSIYEYLGLLDKYENKSNAPHYAFFAIILLSIMIMAMADFTWGFLIFLIAVAYNVVS